MPYSAPYSAIRLFSLAVALVCASLSSAATANVQTEVIADNLDHPWSVAFLPGGDMLITELSGGLKRLDGSGELHDIANVPAVLFAGQGGLFDVLPAPDFARNQQVYLSYSAGTADANATEVTRAVLKDDQLTDLEQVFQAAPKKYAPLHFGGRMTWLPQGDLLLTTGDGFDFREKAQGTGNHFGKTILIQVAGVTASPLPEAPLVYSYGHRNPQGLVVARDGTIYQHEHGPKGGDEVNVILPGENYGWPAITYGMDYNGAYVSPFTDHPDMRQPLHVWVPSIAPSGLMVYEGNMFPEWQGDLFVGALVDGEVRRLDMAEGKIVGETAEFPSISARIRDVRQAPDGAIIVVTDGADGKVYRVSKP